MLSCLQRPILSLKFFLGRYGIIDDVQTIPIGQTTEVNCMRPEKFTQDKYDAFWVEIHESTLLNWRKDHSRETVNAYLAKAWRIEGPLLVENATSDINGYFACFVENHSGVYILVQTIELKVQGKCVTSSTKRPTNFLCLSHST